MEKYERPRPRRVGGAVGLGAASALAIAPLLVPPVGSGSVLAAGLPAQPALLRLAAAHPDMRVRVIVQEQSKHWQARQQITRLGGRVTADLSFIHAVAATLPARAVSQLARSSGVRYVSLDGSTSASTYTCCSVATLHQVYDQTIGATQLWNAAPAIRGQGIGVAVVDSDVNFNQGSDDFGNRGIASVKFNSNTRYMVDKYGHGTHVAGIIGGDGALSSGAYVGVAPGANLVNVKVSDDNGQAAISDVINGLQWVYTNRRAYNIRVVNLSLNSTVADSYQVDPLDAAVETLWRAGVVVVVSAGNNGSSNAGVMYAPANDPYVITVGAVDDHGTASTSDDTLASFSSYETLPISTTLTTGQITTAMSKPDLVAPGVNINSTLACVNSVLAATHPANVINTYYFRMSGTSMAAPMVSGAAALLLQSNPNLTPNQVKFRLIATATLLNSTVGMGAGEVNVAQAVSSTSTASANTNLVPAASTQQGNPAYVWSSTGNTASWGSASWGSASWGSASWGSASWGSASWGSASWGSDYWGP